uniref:Centrosomal protein 192 n=1 Tax=Varanus komodoensis TaxID=61221 RepID=A0A8D2LUA2_VARKO
MEDIRNIADETFPSFLANSITSHAGEILDNITISSNFGLPVAASTEARQRTSSYDRLCDQISYTERKFLASSNSGESDPDPRRKLILNFQDTFCDEQLEAYFEQLVLPEMEDIEERELGEYIEDVELPTNQVILSQCNTEEQTLKFTWQPVCTSEGCGLKRKIPPHNVVYQNEEGRWVTDLAYYTSFNEEQAFNLSSVSGDFITGTDAIAMFVQDQEEFEREHKFMQEEKMDPQNTSALGDSSWKSVNSYNPLKVSETEFSKDASFLRLSLGEFFGQRSEALGCLGGGGDVKRPSFGYYITSPEKRQPVPLLRQSDVSRANSDEPNLQISDPLQVEETKVKSEHNDLDPSLLSISTIASAIADASLSAEPSQLAALMMKLSNKHKEKTNIQEMGRLPDLSVISQLLSSNVEDNTFDIEKYLRRTDVGNNNEPESIVKHEETATDCHRSLYKQESEMGNADLLNFYIQYGKNKQHLEKIYEENDSIHVKVPEEVKFPGACCVGLTSHTVLSIFNPSERWLQVSIHLLGIMLDGLKMDISKHRCLLFKNKTVIGPCATEELKILFLPCQAGVFQCILSVAAWPFSADADAIIQAEALASRVIVNAVAENPDIEVEAGKANHLDFGDLPSGSWKALPLKLTNKTHARVPIRLVIHANAIAWRCFTFSKEPIGNTLPAYNISQLAAPSVISHVMNACCDGQDPEVLVVWVQFRAPSKCTSSDSLGPPDEYFARIDVEVDCPEPGNVLRNVPLSARSGTPRVYAPKGLQVFLLNYHLRNKSSLFLHSSFNCSYHLFFLDIIYTLEPGNSISVKPEHLILKPEEEQEVTVEFCPKDYRNVESVVKILVLPSGPEYKVTVKGDVSVEESRHSVQKCPSSDVPPILANKQLLAWGGVQLGRTVQQKLILRNGSPSTTQQLRMLIRGQDQDCFQLKLGDHMYNNCEIKIRPKHDYSVCLTFSPSRLACMFAKLEMKQLGLLSQLGIKFTIPLYGYGGKSNVILEDVKKQSNGYVVELCEPSSGKSSQASFSVHNTGYRAAFVKVLCYKNFCEKITMDPNVLRIFPDKFVLKESSQQVNMPVTCFIPEKPSMTLDVLPVKGPVGCALSSKASGLDEIRLVSQDTWSLQPEFLIFTAPSQSGTTVTKYAQITNNSNRSLKFELSWPAHCLTITPQLGDIEPGASISIHVSPNPSLAENKSVFPWSGLIYIHCDERQKLIKVQIRENTSEKPSGKDLPVAKEAAHDQHPELPVIHIRPLQKPPSTKLEIKNRTVFFPETGSGKSSGKLCFDVDESGEVYRATYTTFQCSCLSGTLEAHGKQKVITFLPRDRGQYSQFWDLECHPIHHSHVKDKHRLQFCGMVRVCAQEDVYTFPPTRIGESSTLKICVRNYSTSPNRFKPMSSGTFKGVLVVETDKSGTLTIQLLGEGLSEQ